MSNNISSTGPICVCFVQATAFYADFVGGWKLMGFFIMASFKYNLLVRLYQNFITQLGFCSQRLGATSDTNEPGT